VEETRVSAPGAVFCVGNAVADIVARPVERLPAPGASQKLDQVVLSPGGNAVNTAIALARLGVPVRLAAPVGRDRLGQMLCEAVRSEGIGDAGIVKLDGAQTSVTLALVMASGERRFLHFRGANSLFSDCHVDWSMAEGARVFHYASAFALPSFDGAPLVRTLARAKQLGCVASVNICWDQQGRWLSLLRPALAYTDIIFPNLDEGFQLTGERDASLMARRLRELGVRTVVVKLGAKGCYVDGPEGALLVPGFEVSPVDTTGAGDCFAAAFLAAVCWGESLQDAARVANAAGALATLGMGASDSAPKLQQVLEFLGGELHTRPQGTGVSESH